VASDLSYEGLRLLIDKSNGENAPWRWSESHVIIIHEHSKALTSSAACINRHPACSTAYALYWTPESATVSSTAPCRKMPDNNDGAGNIATPGQEGQEIAATTIHVSSISPILSLAEFEIMLLKP
jgi:hypothetical protein